jgi:amidase
MGQVKGLPVGISFIGPKWSEATLLALGYAFEQRARARFAPSYLRTIDDLPAHHPALAPGRLPESRP